MSRQTGIPKTGWIESRAAPALMAAALAADLALTACGGSGSDQVLVDNHIGYDVSHAQCKKNGNSETADIVDLPKPGAFSVVGLNGGNADSNNPCLTKLFTWAQGSSGEGTQQKVAFYVNTANPGPVFEGKPVANWPTSGTNKVGICTPQAPNSNACAYQYGINIANKDLSRLPAGSASDAKIWLDVEQSGTTWQSNHELNVVVLQGMARTLSKAGHSTGIYSSTGDWNSIAGGVNITDASSVYGLDNWMSGSETEAEARTKCGEVTFASGRVIMSQIQQKNELDQNYSCA